MIQKRLLSVSDDIYINKETPIMKNYLTQTEQSRIIEMAWEDRTPFEAISQQYGLTEDHVISLMRSALNIRSFKHWRKRVRGRKTKHMAVR